MVARPVLALLVLLLVAGPAVAGFTDEARDADVYVVLQPSACGAGVSVVDVDNDGLHDIFMTDGPGLPRRLWINQGGLVFDEQATAWGLTSPADGRCGIFGDYDNDGDLDLFLGNWAGGNQLYRNEGTHFVEVTAGSGLGNAGITNGAAWGDIDDDGLLDLCVAVYDQTVPNRLYRNLGGGQFQDITVSSGMLAQDLSFQPVFTDIDRDGDLDLFITSDKDDPNRLWRNDGGGVFTEIAGPAGVAGPYWAMGTAIGDPDFDGDMDLYVTNIPDGNYLYANDGTGSYADVTTSHQVALNRFGWATEFLDYDNDGDEDLYVVNFDAFPGPISRNALYRHDGVGNPYAEVAAAEGVADERPGFGLGVADLDGDGWLDMVVSNLQEFTNLFHNGGGTHHWIQIEPKGSVSNSFGIGAWITVEAGGQVQHREIRAGSGYLSQSPPLAHFGLGDATQVDRVEIRWPSGIVQVLSGLAADTRHVVQEGSPVAVVEDAPRVRVDRVAPNPFNPRVAVQITVASAVTVAPAIYDAAGRRVRGFPVRRWSPGPQVLEWDGTGDAGTALASGVYHLRLLPGVPAVALTLVR